MIAGLGLYIYETDRFDLSDRHNRLFDRRTKLPARSMAGGSFPAKAGNVLALRESGMGRVGEGNGP